MNARQRRALEAICEAFAPRGDGWPSPTELGVVDAVLEGALRVGADRRLRRLLSAWDLVATAGRGRFGALPAEQREAVLLRWCDSRLGSRRAVFHALRKAVLTSYYLAPDNPAWARIGYPGPLGAREVAGPRALRYL